MQLQREQRGLRGLEAVEHDLALLKKAVRHVIPDIAMRSTHVVTTEVDTEDSSVEEESERRKDEREQGDLEQHLRSSQLS